MDCSLCGGVLSAPNSDGDMVCSGCWHIWYETGFSEAPLASRRIKVKLTKIPEPGDKYTDVIRPVKDKPC